VTSLWSELDGTAEILLLSEIPRNWPGVAEGLYAVAGHLQVLTGVVMDQLYFTHRQSRNS
jgi:hypothetical protein